MGLHINELGNLLKKEKTYAAIAETLYDLGVKGNSLKALEDNTNFFVDLGLDDTSYQNFYEELEFRLNLKPTKETYKRNIKELVDHISNLRD